MKNVFFLLMALMFHLKAFAQSTASAKLTFYPADNTHIQFIGRIDFTNPKLPRFWQPGVYINIQFVGSTCELIINDEVLWGNKHNYLEVIVDGVAKRIQTKTKHDTIVVAQGLSAGKHELTICKNTEANIGFLELVGFRCKELVKPRAKPTRKIECIGNSITCGTGVDQSAIPCGKGVWEDQHNAYMSYGPVMARQLNAQYHLSAVSGIGLMRSCCNMDIVMPPVFNKVSMRNDTILWNFKKYQPDMLTVCLGQNDGIQDSTIFCNNYIAFIKQLRGYYPHTTIVCLTSPMADAKLVAFMKKTLTAIVKNRNENGDKKVASYFFSKQYHNGCDGHPDMKEQTEIADELVVFVKKKMNWK